MNKRIPTDSDMKTLLKGGTYFKKYRKICRKQEPLLYHNWRMDIRKKFVTVINGDQNVLDALKEMLQCLCKKDMQDKSQSALFSYGVGLVSVFVPATIFMTQIFFDFSSNVANMQKDAIANVANVAESMQMLYESFQYSIKEVGIVITIALVLLCGLMYIQRVLDHYALMYKLYLQELSDIVDTIVISGDESIPDQVQ